MCYSFCILLQILWNLFCVFKIKTLGLITIWIYFWIKKNFKFDPRKQYQSGKCTKIVLLLMSSFNRIFEYPTIKRITCSLYVTINKRFWPRRWQKSLYWMELMTGLKEPQAWKQLQKVLIFSRGIKQAQRKCSRKVKEIYRFCLLRSCLRITW